MITGFTELNPRLGHIVPLSLVLSCIHGVFKDV